VHQQEVRPVGDESIVHRQPHGLVGSGWRAGEDHHAFRHGESAGLYFESAAAIVTLVLLGQVLYSFESNTRSATIIGAIVGGGIGLLLTQAISTQKDWEEVAYYMMLIIAMVIIIDSISGWLRRKLIKGE
jgi:hypothetical protein